MKVNVKEDVGKFEPFVLEVTVETPEELRELWHRANFGSALEGYAEARGYSWNPSIMCEIWNALDDKARSLGVDLFPGL